MSLLRETGPMRAAARAAYREAHDIPGWLLPADGTGLFNLARKHGGVILEVGTYRGKSAAILNKGAASKWRWRKPQFFSIDIDPAAGIHAKEILGARGLSEHAVFFHGTLADFRRRFPITPTMAFIDGDHTYQGVAADLAELSTLLRPGTPVAFHDYTNTDTPGVSKAVDEWCEDGFARKVGTFGCCAHVVTTARCGGRRKADSRIVALKEVAAGLMPWLVPIIRRLRSVIPRP
jgi:predicted O-methyltransferase YrrM